jgi:hypothetical protein
MAAYQAVVAARAPAASAECGCPNYGNPCCRQGQCSETCGDELVDLDACAAAGGTCVPYPSEPDGGPGCIRIAYCLPPSLDARPLLVSVCCPTMALVDGGGD